MKTRFLTLLMVNVTILFSITAQVQTKTVLLDVSHDFKTEYTKVNPKIFEEYKELIQCRLGTNLVINENKELSTTLLATADVVIILSPLAKSSLKNLTQTERTSLVTYVKKGGKLILFTDEDNRMNIDAFGANDVINPFGMHLGADLDKLHDVTAISIVGEVIKGKYELPYTGSRELIGGIPISVRNSSGGFVHGAYAKLDNGGKIVAFGETMVGLFMGGVVMTRPDGSIVRWSGKDDKQFMQELIEWMLK